MIPSVSRSRSNSAWGICVSTPAPSPVCSSEPLAPRWLRFSSTVRASSNISYDFLPPICATKPMPQASCSNAGSYSPCFFGYRCRSSIIFPISAQFSIRSRFYHSQTLNVSINMQVINVFLSFSNLFRLIFSDFSIYHPLSVHFHRFRSHLTPLF